MEEMRKEVKDSAKNPRPSKDEYYLDIAKAML
jgi:hypothetical protein